MREALSSDELCLEITRPYRTNFRRAVDAFATASLVGTLIVTAAIALPAAFIEDLPAGTIWDVVFRFVFAPLLFAFGMIVPVFVCFIIGSLFIALPIWLGLHRLGLCRRWVAILAGAIVISLPLVIFKPLLRIVSLPFGVLLDPGAPSYNNPIDPIVFYAGHGWMACLGAYLGYFVWRQSNVTDAEPLG
jgi:hypothetical protein